MEYAKSSRSPTNMPKIIFLKSNQTFQLKEGTELKRAPYFHPSIPLKFGCCQGDCGTCAIKVIEGEKNLSPKTKQEQVTLNRLGLQQHRLACQCDLLGDIAIDN